MKRRMTFSTSNLGAANTVCERAMKLGLSVDRTRSATGGFVVAAFGEAEAGTAVSLAHGLMVEVLVDEVED